MGYFGDGRWIWLLLDLVVLPCDVGSILILILRRDILCRMVDGLGIEGGILHFHGLFVFLRRS